MQSPPRPPSSALLAIAAASLLVATGAPAQEATRRGLQVEASGRATTLVGGTFPGQEKGVGLQGAARYLWPSGVSLAAGILYAEPNDLTLPAAHPRRHLEEFGGYAEARLQLPGSESLRPFSGLRAGWRSVRSETDGAADGSGVAGSLLAGVEAWPAERVGLRLAGVVSAMSLDGFPADRTSAASGWSLEFGVSYFLGSVDGDGDGVADPRDECPGTPTGLAVGADGCPPDGDGDGVVDARDRCPDTGAGLTAAADGCVPDTDADGVPDGRDACPETPPGSGVGARGCRPDGDDDGVPDAVDRCPGTRPGAGVDAEGCSEVRAGLREGRFAIAGLPFRSGGIQVDDPLERALEEAGRELRRDEGLRLEVRVQTDTVGTADYNRDLSRRLARAAREYLLDRFPGVDPARVTATGIGEEPPEGEDAGNRVVLVVRSGEGEGGSR